MKPGDRVRVLRGPHEGRLGTITDISARRAAVDAILRPSEIRTRLLAKLDVPADHRAVYLDPNIRRDMGRMDSLEVIPANFLMHLTGPLASGRMELDEFLNQLEAKAHAAPVGVWLQGRGGEVLSDGPPPHELYDGFLVAESCMPSTIEYILATQPKVALALVAKMREARDLMIELAQASGGNLSSSEMASWLNHLQDRIVAWSSIEVP